MPTDNFKGIAFVKVHVVNDRDAVVVNLNQIEGVLFALATTTTLRCRCPALHNDNPVVSMFAWIEVQ